MLESKFSTINLNNGVTSMPINESLESIVPALKSLAELLKVAKPLIPEKSDDARKIIDSASNKLTSIREDVVTLREECASLNQKKMELEAQLSKLTCAERYTLAKTAIGGTAFKLKAPSNDIEANTYFCVNCVNQGKNSILQPHPFRGDRAIGARKVDLFCFVCNSEY